MLAGVYKAQKKDGDIYFRANITFRNKHISLGSFSSETKAHEAYLAASDMLSIAKCSIMEAFDAYKILSFEKIICLLNFRDNGVYIKNPIYLFKTYFEYYLTHSAILKFDIDDLFYYSSHKILKRGGHLYVNDYGMQYNILSRYGIKNYGISGKDYIFINKDNLDFRYGNIDIINNFHGVSRLARKNKIIYQTQIHLIGYYTIGTYPDERTAAIAYNKAVDAAKDAGISKNFPTNFIDSLSAFQYAEIYSSIHLSKKYSAYLKTF